MLRCTSCTATCTWNRFIVFSFDGCFCGWSTRAATAAVLGEVTDECIYVLEVGAVDHEATGLPALNQPRSCQVGEVERKRCAGELELFANAAGSQAFLARLDQHAEHSQSSFVREGGKCFGGLRRIHIPRIVELS